MDANLTLTKKHREILAKSSGPVELTFTPRQLRGKTVVRLTPKQAVLYQIAVQTNTPLSLKLSKKQAGGWLSALLGLGKAAAKIAGPELLRAGAKSLGDTLGARLGTVGMHGDGMRMRGGDVAVTDDSNILARPTAAGRRVIGGLPDVDTVLAQDIPSVSGFSAPPVKISGHAAFY